jgi:hypothetical protein
MLSKCLQAGMLSAFKKKKADDDDPKKPKSRSASVSVTGTEPPQKSLPELVHQVCRRPRSSNKSGLTFCFSLL